jgi:flagellar biosynthesis/type III secretory pathway chaperone
MDGGRLLTELDTLLAAQLEAVQRLRGALMAERAALEQRDAAALARAAADKAGSIEAIEDAESRRRALCMRIGAGPGHPELAAWLETFSRGDDLSRRLRERVAELATALRECRAANQANGLVVATLQRRVQQALGLLRSGSPGPSTYGPGGLPVAPSLTRASLRA